MSEKSLKNHLKAKTNEFLGNKGNAEALRTIIDSFKVSEPRVGEENMKFRVITFQIQDAKQNSPCTTHILSLEAIFVDLLKNGDLKIDVVPLQPNGELHKRRC